MAKKKSKTNSHDAPQESVEKPSSPEETAHASDPQTTPNKSHDAFKADAAGAPGESPEETSTKPPAAEEETPTNALKEISRPSDPQTPNKPHDAAPKVDAADSPGDSPEDTSTTPPAVEEATNAVVEPQETVDVPKVPSESADSLQRKNLASETPTPLEETTLASDPQETPSKPLDDFPETDAADSPEETLTAPPAAKEAASAVVEPQETVDVLQVPAEPVDSSERQNLASEEAPDVPNAPQETPETTDSPEVVDDLDAPEEFRETTYSLGATDLPNAPRETTYSPDRLGVNEEMTIPSPLMRRERKSNEGTKRVSIDKIHRFSFKLAILRNKQFAFAKKLKIVQTARTDYGFSDLEIKSDLSQRKPEKELLLYLYSENKRMEEKCFLSEVETKKCQVMTSFYANKRDMALTVLETIAAMGHNSDAETYLRSIGDTFKKSLKEAQAEFQKHQEAMVAKNKEFQHLAMEMMNSAQANGVSQQLRTKLQKGVDLEDDEILQLTLDKCQETNNKLKTSIQTLGVQVDNLREQYLWKRDAFVTKLSSEFDQTPLVTVPISVGGPGLSSPERIRSPSCNKGKSMRDIEEELASLRKENFDLKMRVYVLNEQMELFQNVDNADQLYEVNSELKKEVEKLKAELSEKDELVLKAGEAMNLLSAKHREDVENLKMELQEQCSSLQDMNLRLEQEVERMTSHQNMTSSQIGPGMEDSSTQYALAFAPLCFNKPGADVTKLEDELAEKLKVIEENERLIKEYDEAVSTGKLRQKELEDKLKSMSESLSGLTQEIREKENHRQQIVKKACELEEYVSLKQLEVDKLQKMLIAKPTHEDMRDLRNKYECCTTENNVLINRITELENKLDYEAIQEKKCSSCRQNKDLADLLERSQIKLSQKERELEQAKKEQYTSVKALQGCLKANKALTADIESLNKQIKACGCSDSKIPQKESTALKVKDLVEKVLQLQQEKNSLAASMEESVEALRRQLEEKENIIMDLEQKSADFNNNKIEELEAQVLRLKSEMEGLSSSEAAYDVEKKQLLSDVESKKKEIETLNEELRKRTFNLQELVNTELWDKNREIEKLNKACERKQQEVMSLKERLTSQEYELRALNDKMQELSDQVATSESVSELKAKLTEEVEKKVLLESEVELWKKTAEESEKVRKELTCACGLFKARLEELAWFLESLLPCLGSRKRKILQDAIDRSRETSRTLSQSVMNENGVNEISLTVPILPDFSQVDFFSDNDIDVTVDANKSCMAKQNEEVLNLRSKMESVVQKLDEVRGTDKSKNCWKINNYEDRFDFVKLANMSSSFNIEEVSEVSLQESFSDTASAPSRQPSRPRPAIEVPPAEKVYNKASALSESEGWSEPDRNVSLARIGLRDSSVPVGRLSTEESSDNSCKVAICKRRCEAAEIRRLSLKVRSLERVIQNLRTDRTSNTRSPSRDISPSAGGDAPEKLISAVDDLKKEKDKLEESLKNNKNILNQLTASYGDEPTNKELQKAVHIIAQQFEQIFGFFTEMEDHYLVIEEEKEAVHRALEEKEKKVDSLNKEVASLQAELKEKENEILEKQCALLEMKNGYILIENKCKMMESTIDELSKWKAAMQKSEEELEAMKDSHFKEINNLKNKLKRTKEERDAEVNELKSSLDRAFKRIDDVCLKKVLMETEFKQKVDSLQKEKRLEVEQEVIRRIEVERKLVESYESQSELRKRLDEEITKSKDVETAQKDMRAELEQRVAELEESNKELLRKLKALRGSQHLSDIESPPPFSRQRSHPTSDYTSDPDQHELKGSSGNLNHWFPVCGRSNNNCSPDLGIESDQGRLSSLDPPIASPKNYGDMEREITYLKRELTRKSKLLEDARRSKLVKEQLEDKIYSELGKTQDLLEKTKRTFKKAQI